MATIPRPVTKTLISTTQWGVPITDQVNANTIDLAALKPTAWTDLTLQNGYLPNYAPKYRKVGDVVELRGQVVRGAFTVNTVIATLPPGYRPPAGFVAYLGIVYYYAKWYSSVLLIGSDGNLKLGETLLGTPEPIPLDNLSFSTVG